MAVQELLPHCQARAYPLCVAAACNDSSFSCWAVAGNQGGFHSQTDCTWTAKYHRVSKSCSKGLSEPLWTEQRPRCSSHSRGAAPALLPALSPHSLCLTHTAQQEERRHEPPGKCASSPATQTDAQILIKANGGSQGRKTKRSHPLFEWMTQIPISWTAHPVKQPTGSPWLKDKPDSTLNSASQVSSDQTHWYSQLPFCCWFLCA